MYLIYRLQRYTVRHQTPCYIEQIPSRKVVWDQWHESQRDFGDEYKNDDTRINLQSYAYERKIKEQSVTNVRNVCVTQMERDGRRDKRNRKKKKIVWNHERSKSSIYSTSWDWLLFHRAHKHGKTQVLLSTSMYQKKVKRR